MAKLTEKLLENGKMKEFSYTEENPYLIVGNRNSKAKSNTNVPSKAHFRFVNILTW